MKLRAIFVAVVWFCLAAGIAHGQIDPSILKPVGYHPSDVTYFNTPYFANSLAMNGEWFEFSDFNFCGGGEPNCTSFDYSANTTQFVNGYPQFLGTGGSLNNRGPFLRALLFGLNINNTSVRPAGWPAHDTLAKGRYVVEWTGTADVRLKSANCTFISGDSSGAATGNLTNGRRAFLCTDIPESLEIRGMSGALSNLKVWMPAVDNPATAGVLENETSTLEDQTFHPLLLERIADAKWGFIRFMDWGKTNASPQKDWIDRRVPGHIFQAGIINDRAPTESLSSDGDRETGVAYEHMVALCNATGKDLWINVPHLATADYITKLAQLIRFGSDGVNPYTTTNGSPVFPPLNSNLKVYVEFSNEIWSSGFSFAQGTWAEEQGNLLFPGDPEAKQKFNARKFCDTWKIFQTVFAGETSRLVRVAAIFTANDGYSQPFMEEIGTYGQSLSPTVRPDVLALTTYFGNDIQGFVNTENYTTGKLFNDPYWQSDLFDTHQHLAFEEWKRRILAGDSASGGGPDATGTSGGFSSTLRDLAKNNLPYCPQTVGAPPCIPLIAYEGGPSIFTDVNSGGTDSGNTDDDDNVTIFVEAMNRDPRIADVYRIHLELARSKGLWTHNPYTDTSPWSRFGQWGHLELLEQKPKDSPKYSLMLEHFSLFSALKHVDEPADLVPSFSTAATLPTGIAGQTYGPTTINTTGGNPSRSVAVVGALLDAGLTISSPTADSLQISGTPITSRKNFIFARVKDADGDPSWRTFTLQTFGGPGTLVQSNFTGTNPSSNSTWTPTFVLHPSVTWSGWSKGGGIIAEPGNDAFFFSVDSDDTDSTLTEALNLSMFLSATVDPDPGPVDLRNGELRFSIKRVGDHSPKTYTLFSSVGGFTLGNHLFTVTVDALDKDETEYIVTIPNVSGFNTSSPIEFRIYGSDAKFDGHLTSLTGFKLTTKQPITVTSMSSNAGPTGGGQTVIITGLDLASASSVTFGGVGSTIVSNTSTAITVTTPPGSAGTVSVVVTTGTGSVTLNGAYTYLSAPTISTINPNSGSTNGGQTVTITGTLLSNATATFDGLPAGKISNTATALVVTTPPHAAGAVNVVVTTAGGSDTETNGYTYAAPVAPAAPANLVAAATSTSQIDLTWNTSAGAIEYQVDRKEAGGGFVHIASTSTNSFSDTGRASSTSYLYRVRAVGNGGGISTNSNSDLATTVIFTDPTLTPGTTTVKSVHVTQLRTAANAVRTLAGLGAFSFTGTAASGTTISAIHLTDLRTAIDAARTLLGLSTGGFTDGAPTNVAVKALHWQEVRGRVQ